MTIQTKRTQWSRTSGLGKRLLPLLVASLLLGCSSGNNGPNPSGTLEATQIDLGSTLPARIAAVLVNEGDAVSKGDTLVQLDTALLRLQRAQTAAYRASLDAQVRVARDNQSQAQDNLKLQELTLARLAQLVEQGSVTRQQYDEAQTRRDVAAAQVSASRHQLDALAAEGVKLDAGLSVMDRQISDGTILSPIDGTVLLRNVEPGEVVTMGGTLLRIANLEQLKLRVYLDVEDVDLVSLGQQVDVLVDALAGQSLKGNISWISAEAEFTPKNAQTRKARSQLVYAIKLNVPNTGGHLHIGMPAEIRLHQD